MFRSHRATHGNSASTKSNTADQAISPLDQLLRGIAKVNIPHMTVAMTVKLSEHPFLGTRGSQIDSTGVHCTKTVIERKILRIMMEMFQNHRKALCLKKVSQSRTD